MALNSFSSGVNTSFSSQLNNNFKEFYRPLLDYTAAEQVIATTVSTTYVELKSVAIPASEITTDILLKVQLMTRGSYGTGGGSRTGDFDIKLDGVSLDVFEVIALGVDGNVSTVETRYVTYKITPSALQISDGFTISVDGKLSSTSGIGGRVGIVGWEVLGR